MRLDQETLRSMTVEDITQAMADVWDEIVRRRKAKFKGRPCTNCGELMIYGTGTGQTKRKRFCMDRCRVAYARSKEKTVTTNL